MTDFSREIFSEKISPQTLVRSTFDSRERFFNTHPHPDHTYDPKAYAIVSTGVRLSCANTNTTGKKVSRQQVRHPSAVAPMLGLFLPFAHASQSTPPPL